MIKVGAATESEMKEKKARVEDAMHSTKAAVEEGIVPGGGVALLRCQKGLKKLADTEKNDDQATGIRIVARSVEEPLRQIANNAGEEGSVTVNHVRGEAGAMGYDAQNNKFVDMIKAGIIDPTKVVRAALQHAASISGLMLTTEAMINEIPEENKPAMPDMGGGGMPGGGMGGF